MVMVMVIPVGRDTYTSHTIILLFNRGVRAARCSVAR